MPVLESVQERKLTSILINSKNCQFFRTVSALSFILFSVDQCSYDKSLALSSQSFVSVVFVIVVLVNVKFSFAVLPAIFVSCIYQLLVFSSSVFLVNLHFETSWQIFTVYFYRHLAIFRLHVLSIAGYISPFSPAFHPFRTPITRPFLSHLRNPPSQWSHPLFSRAPTLCPPPLNSSFIIAPLVS